MLPTPSVDSNISLPEASASTKATLDQTICDSASAIDATINCSSSTECVLTPESDLLYNASYSICLTTDITYASGSSFEGFMATFRTEESSGAPSVSRLSDASNRTISVSGTENISFNELILVFSEAMSDAAVTTAGNISLACGQLTPVISITPVVSTAEYMISVDEAWRYALLECTLTIPAATGLPSDATYTFTNSCAVNDDFNADSQSCWEVNTIANTTWTTWDVLLNGILEFDPANSTLDFTGPGSGAGAIYKVATVDSEGFEIIIHLKQFQNFLNNDAINMGLVGNNPADPAFSFLIVGVLVDEVCYVQFYDSVTSNAVADTACSTFSEMYVKVVADTDSFSSFFSSDGSQWIDFTTSPTVTIIGTMPSSATEVLDNMPGTRYLWMRFDNSGGGNISAEVDSVETSGVSVDNQY